MPKAKQKFQRGDRVRISPRRDRDSPEAIVLYSYADKYGGVNRTDFSIYIKDQGPSAWYTAKELTLIERGREDLLAQWEHEAAVEAVTKSDLDWIFAHGKEILEKPHTASVQALANCFGLTDLWGSHGEGITYFANAQGTLAAATPFLRDSDKVGWLAHAETMRKSSK